MPGFEVGEHAGHADAGVAFEDFLGRADDPVLGQAGEIGLDRQQFAVDQHAVAIEDDQVEGHRIYAPGSAATITIVTLSCAPRASTESSSRPTVTAGTGAALSSRP